MSDAIKPPMHGRDHCPGGSDPIPCLTEAVSNSSAAYIDVYIQNVACPASTFNNISWPSSTPGQSTVFTNDRGNGAETINPATSSFAFTGANFQVDFSGSPGSGLGPTNVKIISPGVYWVRTGMISFDIVTSPFTIQCYHGGAKFDIGGRFGFNSTTIYPPLFTDVASEYATTYVVPTTEASSGFWKGCLIRHNSPEMSTCSAELTIIKLASLPSGE